MVIIASSAKDIHISPGMESALLSDANNLMARFVLNVKKATNCLKTDGANLNDQMESDYSILYFVNTLMLFFHVPKV